MQNSNSAQMQGVSSIAMNVTCGNSLSIGKHVTPSGVDANRAFGMAITHPEKLSEVCGMLNRAVLATLVDPAHPSTSAAIPGKNADNSEIYTLSNVLGMSRSDAEKIISSPLGQEARNKAFEQLQPKIVVAPEEYGVGPSFSSFTGS